MYISILLTSIFLNIVVIAFCIILSKENKKVFRDFEEIKHRELDYLERIYALSNSLNLEKQKVNMLKDHSNCKYWSDFKRAELTQDKASSPCLLCENFSLWEVRDELEGRYET